MEERSNQQRTNPEGEGAEAARDLEAEVEVGQGIQDHAVGLAVDLAAGEIHVQQVDPDLDPEVNQENPNLYQGQDQGQNQDLGHQRWKMVEMKIDLPLFIGQSDY